MTGWQRPFAIIAGTILAVDLAMLGLGMGPTTPLVVAVGAVVGVSALFLQSLGSTVAPPEAVPLAVAPAPSVLPDQRVRTLRTRMVFSRGGAGHTERLRDELVELIDDQLVRVHGIDRHAHPDRADALLGPDLSRFVREPAMAESLADPTKLERIIERIEQL